MIMTAAFKVPLKLLANSAISQFLDAWKQARELLKKQELDSVAYFQTSQVHSGSVAYFIRVLSALLEYIICDTTYNFLQDLASYNDM